MMNRRLPFANLSLRTKLVLSYLAVTIGAILFLAFTVSIVVQNYFYESQTQRLYDFANFKERQLQQQIQFGGSLDKEQPDPYPFLTAVMNTAGQTTCSQPGYLTSDCTNPEIRNALMRAMQEKKSIDGDLPIVTQEGNISAIYVAIPLHYNGQIIGSLFLSTPDRGQAPQFLSQVKQAIFLAGIVISLIVVLFSFVLARRFTRPLEVLTMAAEQMKQGKYAQRVTLSKSQDEMGRLAQTFNEMADTIEADVSELRSQEQFRRDLIANIAHDLATPLTAVQGFSEALADEVITDPEVRQEIAQRIGREVQRLRRLVGDMQQMSSIESGQVRLDLAPLDLHSLVDETLAVIEPECENMGISVRNEIEPATPLVLADSDRVTQVLLNLLDNARRHTPEGGKIRVGAVRTEKQLQVWISDTGTGIKSDDLPHIFERFYRADRSRTTATGGSGLGLAIVKAIITAHRGNVWAESTPGEGTRILFTLPLA